MESTIVKALITKKSDCFSELQQNQNGNYEIIFNVLKSKRLLLDHVEILEECLIKLESETSHTNLFSFPNVAFCIATSIFSAKFIDNFYNGHKSKMILPILSAGYASLYLYKRINIWRTNRRIKYVTEIIKRLDSFDVSIKRNLLFFNESSQFRGNFNDVQFINNSISSIRKVTFALYAIVRKLDEEIKLPSNYVTIYEPLEDLTNCHYFTNSINDFEGKHIKEFYNIFLYIQSQLLLRMCLSLLAVTDYDIVKKHFLNIRTIIKEEVDRETNILEQLTTITTSGVKLKNNFIKQSSSSPISNLKYCSLNYTSKILVLANQCRLLDADFQNLPKEDEIEAKNCLLKLISTMKSIEDMLAVASSEFQYLILSCNKFLNVDNENTINEPEKGTNEGKLDNDSVTVLDLKSESAHDEFFLLDGSLQLPENNENDFLDYELNKVNTKLVKSNFKPVLMQLREKINPLNDAMKERERKFMEARGLPFEEHDFKDIDEADGEASSDDDDDEVDDYKAIGISQKTKSKKYDEVREYLSQKQQIGMFPIQPMSSLVSEDILE